MRASLRVPDCERSGSRDVHAVTGLAGLSRGLHLSPLAGRGRRAAIARWVKGALRELTWLSPHPSPLPASGERERVPFRGDVGHHRH